VHRIVAAISRYRVVRAAIYPQGFSGWKLLTLLQPGSFEVISLSWRWPLLVAGRPHHWAGLSLSCPQKCAVVVATGSSQRYSPGSLPSGSFSSAMAGMEITRPLISLRSICSRTRPATSSSCHRVFIRMRLAPGFRRAEKSSTYQSQRFCLTVSL
jgi:hypothetical protein